LLSKEAEAISRGKNPKRQYYNTNITFEGHSKISKKGKKPPKPERASNRYKNSKRA